MRYFAILLTLVGMPAFADEDPPILRIESEGPVSYVRSLAFQETVDPRDPNQQKLTLYAAGRDKTVQAWTWNSNDEEFRYDRLRQFRIPIGPGTLGTVNTVRLSPDGRWLAVAGTAMARELMDFRNPGLLWPGSTMRADQREDMGTIFVFDLQNTGKPDANGEYAPAAVALRGHRGAVVSMAFANNANRPPLLISAAEEMDGEKRVGRVIVWDVLNKKAVADRADLPAPKFIPGLSATRTGPEPKDVQAGIAWAFGDDGKPSNTFRVWNIANNSTKSLEDRPLVNIAAAVSDDAVLTGGFGQIGLWSRQPGQDAPRYQSLVSLGQALPMAATVYASKRNGPNDRAACIVLKPVGANGQFDFQLVIVDIPGRQAIGAPVSLWTGTQRTPSVAVSPRGRFLAASGGPQHGIHLYDLTKLPNVKRLQPMLRGVGEQWAKVRFVSKGQDTGLRLTPTGANATPQVFNIDGRKVEGRANAWTDASASADGWKSETKTGEAGAQSVTITPPDGKTASVALEPESQVTATAFCPASKHVPVPLLALATQRFGEPRLSIYDASTGTRLRVCVGHLEAITDVAFSADGRMLASVAGDSTVRVWWLPDLVNTIGKVGILTGLAVDANTDSVKIVEVEDNSSAAQAGLQANDLIVGIPRKKKLLRVGEPWEFYSHVAQRKPGSIIELKSRRGDNEESRTLKVDQGADTRNPMFTAFFASSENGRGLQWIAWHPLGRYDVSAPAAEKYLGWHFNTGDPASPVRFASAAQYRDQNYDRELLPSLMRDGMPNPQAGIKPPKWDVALTMPGGRPLVNYDGQLLTTTPRVTASIGISDFPLDRVDRLEWTLDGKKYFKASYSVENDRFEDDMSRAKWKRGVHEARLRVWTNEYPPRKFDFGPAQLRFHPPAPQVSFTSLKQRVTVTDQETIKIDGKAIATSVQQSLEPISITLKHRGKVVGEWNEAKQESLDFTEDVTLTPGVNEFELIAKNTNAPKGYEEITVTRWVNFQPKPGKPVFLWSKVEQAKSKQPLAPMSGVFVSSAPVVRLHGVVKATGKFPAKLKSLGYIAGFSKARPGTPVVLAGFKPERELAFDIAHTVTLKPGKQTVRFQAFAGDAFGHDDIPFEYRPPLPEFANVRLSLKQGKDTLVFKRELDELSEQIELLEDRHARSVEIVAEVLPQTEDAFDVGLLLDGEAVPRELIKHDRQARTVAATLALTGREHRIQFVTSNEWHKDQKKSDPLKVHYGSPPTIKQLKATQVTNQLLAEVTARIESPFAFPVGPEGVALTVNGRNLSVNEFTLQRVQDNGQSWWQLAAQRVSIKAGQNTIALSARTTEGSSLPQSITINGIAPVVPKPPPIVDLLSPMRAGTSSVPRLQVRFRVRSPSELSLLELAVRTDRGERSESLMREWRQAKPDDSDGRVLTHIIDLRPGDNSFHIVARNEGATVATEPLTFRYMEPPTGDFVIDKLLVAGETLKPVYSADGVFFDGVATAGQAMLHGRVLLPNDADHNDVRKQFVRVWANGFLKTVRLKFDGTFSTQLTLNQKLNELEVELPVKVRVDEKTRLRHKNISVGCQTPDRSQRLHVLIVGVDMQRTELGMRNVADGDELRQRAEAALSLDDRTDAFDEVKWYPPLVGDQAKSGQILRTLHRVQLLIQSRTQQGFPNDVVVIYYRGREAVNKDGEFVLADRSTWRHDELPRERSLISSRKLSAMLGNMPGAHLLLLDVETKAEDVRHWPEVPHLGVLRVASTADNSPPLLLPAMTRAVPAAAAADGDVRFHALEAAVDRAMGKPAAKEVVYDSHVGSLSQLILSRILKDRR